MSQMTVRASDDVMRRVKAAAQREGRSMNDYVTAVLDAATNPDLADDAAERIRERPERRRVACAAWRSSASARCSCASGGTPRGKQGQATV
jgi:hypothetical protein